MLTAESLVRGSEWSLVPTVGDGHGDTLLLICEYYWIHFEIRGADCTAQPLAEHFRLLSGICLRAGMLTGQ